MKSNFMISIFIITFNCRLSIKGIGYLKFSIFAVSINDTENFSEIGLCFFQYHLQYVVQKTKIKPSISLVYFQYVFSI